MRRFFMKCYLKLIILETIMGSIEGLFNIFIAKNLGLYSTSALNGELKILDYSILKFISFVITFFIIKYFLEYFLSLSEQKSKKLFKFHVYTGFLNSSYEKLEKRTLGEYVTRLGSDFDNIVLTYYQTLKDIFVGILSFLAYFVYLSTINAPLALIISILSILPIIPSIILKDKFKVNFKDYMMVEDKIKKHLNSTIEGFEFIKLNNLKELFSSKIKALFNEISLCALTFEKTVALEGIFNKGLSTLIKCSSYGIVGYFLYKNYISVGVTVQYLILVKQLFIVTNNLFDKYKTFQKGHVSVNRVNELLLSHETSGPSIIRNINEIEFKNVSFSYTDNIFTNLNLVINKGDKLLLKGSNGSGKSTLIKLLLGLYDNYTGEILVNGININHICKRNYRSKIALLTQNQLFFSNNLDDNLSLFNTNNNDISSMLKVFHTDKLDITKAGCHNLSGGQKQKISLIRTLLKDSDLLILDEPTNYLDSSTITTLKTELEKSNKTLLVVNHLGELDEIFNTTINLNAITEVV